MKRYRIIPIALGLALVALGLGLFGLFKVRHTLSAVTGEQQSLTDTLHFLLPEPGSDSDALFDLAAAPVAAQHPGDGAASKPAAVPVASAEDGPVSPAEPALPSQTPMPPQPDDVPTPAPAEAIPVALKRDAPVSPAEPTLYSPTPVPPRTGNPERINILLLGIRGADEPNGAFLSDTIIVASLLKNSDKVALISIPRDLYVDVPGYGYHKINAAYAYGQAHGDGFALAMRTVSAVAGIPIQYAVSVDWQAFREVINTFGGVDVQVQQNFSGDGLTVKKGTVHMDGATALNYAKSRHTSSDFDRSRRQREVIEALATKLESENFFTQPLLALKLLDTLGNHVRTTLNGRQLKALLQRTSQLDFANVIQDGFDVSAKSPLESAKLSNGSYIIVPKAGNYQAFQQVFQTAFQ